MSLDVLQFREFIVRPTLEKLQLHSKAAENLMVGTAMVESRLTYLKQLGAGPALSVYQIEPATYKDLKRRLTLNYRRLSGFALAVLNMDFFPDDPSYLVGNLTAATIFCRLKYFFDPEKLPDAKDYEGLAKYYKRVYNTHLGKADINDVTKIFRSIVFNYTHHL